MATYHTVDGQPYSVTAGTSVTVTDSDGLVLSVKAGEQGVFVGNGGDATVTGAHHIVQVKGGFAVGGGGGGGGGEPFDGHLNANLVIGSGMAGTKAEWSVPLGDIRHQGLLVEKHTGYSIFEGVDVAQERTVDTIVDDINLRSPLKFLVEAVKVSDSEIKLVALEPGTAPHVYSFEASDASDAEHPVESPCFGRGTIARSVDGTVVTPSSTYTATLNGHPMLLQADVLLDVKMGRLDVPVSSDGVYRALAKKQDKLEFDDFPAYQSSNPVKSSGLYPTPCTADFELDSTDDTVKAVWPKSADWAHVDASGKHPDKTFMHPNKLYIVWDNDLKDELANKPVKLPEDMLPDYFTTAELHVFNHNATPISVVWPPDWHWHDPVTDRYKKDGDGHVYSPVLAGNTVMCITVRSSISKETYFEPYPGKLEPYVIAEVAYVHDLENVLTD